MILKPSKYGVHGYVERFHWGFMPNSTVPYLRSMTPARFEGAALHVHAIDEYIQTDLTYMDLLKKGDHPTLLALVGVQSHQFQRSLDLAAYARQRGVEHCVIGGPHPMTCDTTMLHFRGVSFALAEAETVWSGILRDALAGELQPVYGREQRWQKELDSPVLIPPSARDLRRYVIPMIGIYPARGCPFTCNFCSVIKIAGRQIRSQSIETTIASLRAAKAAGVRMILFCSDNFNKYPDAVELLHAMIEERINMPFFVQCDTQIARQEEFIELLSRARCFQMFVGVESFNRKILLAARKTQNHPQLYGEIVRLCRKHGIMSHFSNIIGFPQDTDAGIEDHLETLCGLDPDVASFYILTPIPGTEQYDDFFADGRITEENLDRFDGTCPTWQHENLTAEQLTRLLFYCYRRFYSSGLILRNSVRNFRRPDSFLGLLLGFVSPVFSRFCAFKRMHPMSGGVGRVYLDSVEDYQSLRRKRFGFDLVPLPASLELSPADAAFNSRAKLVSQLAAR